LRKFILSILFLSVSACGYHLREPIKLPDELKNLYVQGASGPLRSEIKKAVKIASAKLVSDPEEAGMVLNILEDNLRQNVLSLSSTGRATEYELYYILSFELLDAEGQTLMPKENIEFSRDFFNDQSGDTILGKEAEATTIRQEMYKQAVRNIFDRARGRLRQLEK